MRPEFRLNLNPRIAQIPAHALPHTTPPEPIRTAPAHLTHALLETFGDRGLGLYRVDPISSRYQRISSASWGVSVKPNGRFTLSRSPSPSNVASTYPPVWTIRRVGTLFLVSLTFKPFQFANKFFLFPSLSTTCHLHPDSPIARLLPQIKGSTMPKSHAAPQTRPHTESHFTTPFP